MRVSLGEFKCAHHFISTVHIFVLFWLYCNDLPVFCCSAGGVELLAKQGRIKVVNTLESRLEMMSKQVLSSNITLLLINKIHKY